MTLISDKRPSHDSNENVTDSFCVSDTSMLSKAEIKSRITRIIGALEHLEIERRMYDRYIKKVGADVIIHDQVALIEGGVIAIRRSKSPTADFTRYIHLTSELKCLIAQGEIEELRQENRHLRWRCERAIDVLRAVAEEADVRMHELKKMRLQFDCLVREGYSSRMRCLISEKFVRHMNDKLLRSDALIDKIRLSNVALRAKLKKLNADLKQQSESSETLTKSDFDTLKLENKQAYTILSIKHAEVAQMKLKVAKTSQVLAHFKMRLFQRSQETPRIQAELHQQKTYSQYLEREIERIYDVRRLEQMKCAQLQEYQESYKVPSVLDYVNCVVENTNLTQQLRKLTHRKYVARVKLQAHKKLWKELRYEAATSPHRGMQTGH